MNVKRIDNTGSGCGEERPYGEEETGQRDKNVIKIKKTTRVWELKNYSTYEKKELQEEMRLG